MPSLLKSFLGLVFIATVGFTAGCKQDPLEGFDKSVRKATPPNTKPEPEISPGDIVIDVADFYDVREGEELTFTVNGAILIPGHTFTISVRNIENFPGLVFDKATSTVTWTAPSDYVKSTDFDIAQMTIVLATNEAPFIFDEKTVHVRVFRNIERPEIISIGQLTQAVVEGDSTTFNVVVKSADETSAPDLGIIRVKNRKNGASFISAVGSPVRDATDKTLWTFSLVINLYDEELTKSLETFEFGLQARSSLGVLSLVKQGSYDVRTALSRPISTWDADSVFTAGERSIFSFVVYDPKFEGNIELDEAQLCRSFPGASCSCAPPKTGLLQCTIDWTPAKPGYFTTGIYAYNKMTIDSVDYDESVYINRAIRVVKGSTP